MLQKVLCQFKDRTDYSGFPGGEGGWIWSRGRGITLSGNQGLLTEISPHST